jgi:hypothetical protein
MLENAQGMSIILSLSLSLSLSLYTAIEPSVGTRNMHQEFGYWSINESINISSFNMKSNSF